MRETLKIAPGASVPVGIGFLGWILDFTEPSADPRLTAVLDEKPAAIWLAFGVDTGEVCGTRSASMTQGESTRLLFS